MFTARGMDVTDNQHFMKNLHNKTVCNVGCIGVGNYKPTFNGKRTKANEVWKDMLQRCYKYIEINPTYKDCSVVEEWHNFQNFAAWFEENYVEGFELDKDILVKRNKIYSPETCCFVPKKINYLFIKCNKTRGLYPIGVSLVHNRFQTTIRKNGKTINLGRFNTIEEAFKAYKIAKEQYIKEVAEKWKSQITEKVYQAMYNYQVEIID